MEDIRAVRLECKACNYRTTTVITKSENCCTCNAEMHEVQPKDISLVDFEMMLKSTDWYSDWSDDRKVIQQGILCKTFMKLIADLHGGVYLDKYHIHYRNGR
jgi:hypothetical protein